MFVLFASYGNDSVALVQWAVEAGLGDVRVAYSDTGWASDAWRERVERGEAWVRSLGFVAVRLRSEGMEALVRRKKGWARQGMQFCTEDLKVRPAMAWLSEIDPLLRATCLVGVRREESANRRDFPDVSVSAAHGGRLLWAPLARMTAGDRDGLVRRAKFEVVPHRSKECFPCVNSKRSDLLLLAKDPTRVAEIERIEESLGFTGNGKPRTMFRPYRHMGATGIREVVRWAESAPGQFDPDDGTGADCDSGYCGT